MIYARISIYQVLKHPWKQSDMLEPAIFKIVKKSAKCQSFFHLFQAQLKTASTSDLSSSINPLHFVERTSVVHYFCVISTVGKLWVYAVQLVISDSPFCRIMRMLV